MTSFYEGEQLTPATSAATELADALFALVDARSALHAEIEDVKDRHRKMDYDPIGYTASYWEVEQEAYNRAAERYERAVVDAVNNRNDYDRRERDRR